MNCTGPASLGWSRPGPAGSRRRASVAWEGGPVAVGIIQCKTALVSFFHNVLDRLMDAFESSCNWLWGLVHFF